MILPAILLVLVVSVPLTGGDLRRFGELPIRGGGWVLLALAIQIVITVGTVPATIGAVLHLVSYLCAGLAVFANRSIPGVPAMAVGGGANLAPIAANGGVMPATPAALAMAGFDHGDEAFVNSGLVDDARLWWLGDVFAIPEAWPLANVFSIGDLVLVIGAGWMMHRVSRLSTGELQSTGRGAKPGPTSDTRADTGSETPLVEPELP